MWSAYIVFCFFFVSVLTLNNDFGSDDDDDDGANRIINGIVALPGQFPHAVQIYPSHCSASIIHSNKWVMTAAHCQRTPVNGQVCRSLINGQQINCMTYQAHNMHYLPEWYPDSQWVVAMDMLLIELDDYFPDVPGFAPSKYMTHGFDLQSYETVYIAGFGQVQTGVHSTILRFGYFPINDFRYENRTITLNNIQFASGPGDSGAGDFVVRNGETYLIGTHAAGSGLNGISVATFYQTRIDWINDIIQPGELPPPPPPPPTPPPGEGCPVPDCATLAPGYYPATDPNQFWQCSNFVALLRNCPPTLVFNVNTNTCAFSGQAACAIG